MPRVCVACLVGLPGAGKSTLARRLVESAEGAAVHVVDFDDALAAQGEQFSAEGWHRSREDALAATRAAVEAAAADPALPALVLLDDNAFYRSMRRQVFCLARDAGCGFASICVPTPVDECRRRNAQRERPVPEESLLRMSASLQWPDGDAHPWESLSVSFVSDPAEVWALVRRVWDAPPPERPQPLGEEEEARRAADREATRRNRAHAVDLATRAVVHDAMEGAAAGDKRALGKALAKARKEFLRSVVYDDGLSVEDVVAPFRARWVRPSV